MFKYEVWESSAGMKLESFLNSLVLIHSTYSLLIILIDHFSLRTRYGEIGSVCLQYTTTHARPFTWVCVFSRIRVRLTAFSFQIFIDHYAAWSHSMAIM